MVYTPTLAAADGYPPGAVILADAHGPVSFVAQWHLPDVSRGPANENGTPTHLWAPDGSRASICNIPIASGVPVSQVGSQQLWSGSRIVGEQIPSVLTAITRSLSVMSSMNVSTLRRRSIRALSMSEPMTSKTTSTDRIATGKPT